MDVQERGEYDLKENDLKFLPRRTRSYTEGRRIFYHEPHEKTRKNNFSRRHHEEAQRTQREEGYLLTSTMKVECPMTKV